MATGGSEDVDSHILTQTRNARNLRELFRGRFTETEAEALLRLFDGDIDRTVDYILNARPGDLSELLDTYNIENRIAVVTRDNVLRDLARKNEICKSIRQFACVDCDKAWWRRVPDRKMVSRCNRCRRKYDALSRNDEWGSAEYECVCGNTFTGWGHMGRTQRRCFQCRELCYPAKILPPLQASGILVFREGSREESRRGRRRGRGRGRGRGPQEEQRYEESGPGVFVHLNDQRSTSIELGANSRSNYQRSTSIEIGVNAHPNDQLSASIELGADSHPIIPFTTRRRSVLSASQLHVSSGSTVNTFLYQGDIDKPEYEPSLQSITEDSD